jgi:hypothetical protein
MITADSKRLFVVLIDGDIYDTHKEEIGDQVAYQLMHSSCTGDELIERLGEQDTHKHDNIKDVGIFDHVYCPDALQNEMDTYNIDWSICSNLFFMSYFKKGSPLHCYDAEKQEFITFQNSDGGECPAITNKYFLSFNSIENMLYVFQGGTLTQYQRHYYEEHSYHFERYQSVKLPNLSASKEVDENCQLLKVFENYLYVRNPDKYELKIWSMTEDRLLKTYKNCNLEGWKQLHSVPAFINLDEI